MDHENPSRTLVTHHRGAPVHRSLRRERAGPRTGDARVYDARVSQPRWRVTRLALTVASAFAPSVSQAPPDDGGPPRKLLAAGQWNRLTYPDVAWNATRP